jgi:hypothetical protein
MRGKRARQREHSKGELDAPSASQATESCKQQSSSATVGALVVGIGQNQQPGSSLPVLSRGSHSTGAAGRFCIAAEAEVAPVVVELLVTAVPLSWLHSEGGRVLLDRGVSDTLAVTE